MRAIMFRKIFIIILFASVFVFLSVYRIGVESIWNDEWLTVSDITRPNLPDFFRFIKVNEDTPPLYFLLLRWWSLNGTKIDMPRLRMFSALWAFAGLAGVYLLAKTLNGKRSAILASLLYITSPYIVWYAQEARNVMMQGALSVISMYFFYKFARDGCRKHLVLSSFVLVAGLYTHYFFLFLIPTQFIYIWFYRKDLMREWLFSAAVVTALFAPWVPVMINQVKIARIAWLEPPTLYFPIQFFAAFCTGLYYKINDLWAIFAVWIYLIFFIAGILRVSFREKTLNLSFKPDNRAGFAVIFFFAPLVMAYGVSFVKPVLYEGKRYLMLILPLFFLIAGEGISRIGRRKLVFALAAAVIVFNSYFLYDLYAGLQKRPWDKLSGIIRKNAVQGDILYSADYTKGKILYYYGIEPVKRVDLEDIKLFKKTFRGHNRVWFVADVDNTPQQRLFDGVLPVIFSRLFVNSAGLQLRLTLYDTSQL